MSYAQRTHKVVLLQIGVQACLGAPEVGYAYLHEMNKLVCFADKCCVPAEVDTPAPVSTTMFFAFSEQTVQHSSDCFRVNLLIREAIFSDDMSPV